MEDRNYIEQALNQNKTFKEIAKFLSKDPTTISKEIKKHRTRIFFCNPGASYQKGSIEKNHEFIRYVIPKGVSMDNLTQEDITKMINHIN